MDFFFFFSQSLYYISAIASWNDNLVFLYEDTEQQPNTISIVLCVFLREYNLWNDAHHL